MHPGAQVRERLAGEQGKQKANEVEQHLHHTQQVEHGQQQPQSHCVPEAEALDHLLRQSEGVPGGVHGQVEDVAGPAPDEDKTVLSLNVQGRTAFVTVKGDWSKEASHQRPIKGDRSKRNITGPLKGPKAKKNHRPFKGGQKQTNITCPSKGTKAKKHHIRGPLMGTQSKETFQAL